MRALAHGHTSQYMVVCMFEAWTKDYATIVCLYLENMFNDPMTCFTRGKVDLSYRTKKVIVRA